MNGIGENPQEAFKLLLQNTVFLTTVASFAVCQILKAVITLMFNRQKKAKDIIITLVWSTGGMPSSHASVVSAMATSTALYEGLASTPFAIALFLALIVVRDALGVRRAAGIQAKAFNAFGKSLSSRIDVEFQPVKEIQGHTPSEVVVGVLVGVLNAFLFRALIH